MNARASASHHGSPCSMRCHVSLDARDPRQPVVEEATTETKNRPQGENERRVIWTRGISSSSSLLRSGVDGVDVGAPLMRAPRRFERCSARLSARAAGASARRARAGSPSVSVAPAMRSTT